MQVECKFFATLKMELGTGAYSLEATQDFLILYDVLKLLDDQFNHLILETLVEGHQDSNPITGAIILLNGKNILLLEKLQTIVRDGDELIMFPPVGGG